jgi:hypothetical protein
MINDPEARLIEALKNVDAHGDVAPPHVHHPMIMALRDKRLIPLTQVPLYVVSEAGRA